MHEDSRGSPPGATVEPPDPQRLLPAGLRGDWIVAPRRAVQWLFATGVLLGTGLGLSGAGIAFGPAALVWGLAASFLVVTAGTRLVLLGYEQRKLRELEPYLVAGLRSTGPTREGGVPGGRPPRDGSPAS